MKGVSQVVRDFEHMFQLGEKKDAVSILKRDHHTIRQLISSWESARSRTKKEELLVQIIKELLIHELVEEDLVYPLLEESQRTRIKEKTRHGLEEQHLLKIQLAELAALPADSPLTKAKMMVLKDNVVHHARHEENILFPALKSSEVMPAVLGQEICNRKQQLLSESDKMLRAGKSKNRAAVLLSVIEALTAGSPITVETLAVYAERSAQRVGDQGSESKTLKRKSSAGKRRSTGARKSVTSTPAKVSRSGARTPRSRGSRSKKFPSNTRKSA